MAKIQYLEELEEITKIIRKANWMLLEAEYKYRQIFKGTSTHNDAFRKVLDDAEIATAAAHSKFWGYIKNDPLASMDSLAFMPGEAADVSEASKILEVLKLQERENLKTN